MTDNHTDLIAHLLDPIGDNHCVDCCCARSWTALGVSEYDGKSIPEHITILRERIAALERHGYVVAMRLMQSEVRLDDAEQAGLDAFITKVAARAALGERK